MAGIYERENINYPSIMAAVAQARARDAERRGDYVRSQGELWGNTAKNLVNTAGRAIVGHMDNGPESWSYVAEGDRSGLDRLRAADIAAENRAQEQEWQWKKMNAEQAHAEKLAKAQREAQKSFEMDKMLKQYKDSIAMRDALRATGDPNDPMINAKIAQLDNEITFYGDRLGLNTQKNNTPQPPAGQVAEEPTQGQDGTEGYRDTQTWKSREEDFAQLEKSPWTEDTKNKMMELIEHEDRPDVKNRMLQTVQNRGKTREEISSDRRRIIGNWNLGEEVPPWAETYVVNDTVRIREKKK